MARKVFFSFHYERDAWRAGQVRNSNITQAIKGYLD
ncbi:TIR domain-containing protein [Bacillus safensis]